MKINRYSTPLIYSSLSVKCLRCKGKVELAMIILATEHKYNDNSGAYSIAHTWNGREVSRFEYANEYDGLPESAHKANATPEQLSEAIEWYLSTAQNKGERKYPESSNPKGCVVQLKRCRKALNKTDLEVIDWMDSGYDGDFYQPEQILVMGKNNELVWVSANCIDTYMRGLAPIWA